MEKMSDSKERIAELNEQLREALKDGNSAKFAQILEKLTGSKDAANEFLRRVISKVPVGPSSQSVAASPSSSTAASGMSRSASAGFTEVKDSGPFAESESSMSESVSSSFTSSIAPVPITPAVLTEAEFSVLSSFILKSINFETEDSSAHATTGSVEPSASKATKSS